MKFVHLSDLHLGKRVNEFSMIEDQKYILNQIENIIEEESPKAVLIAGDVFDRGIPTEEAMKLWDDFLTNLSKKQCKVLVISGNHDSAIRLSEHYQLVESAGIYLAPAYNGQAKSVILKDQYGELEVYMLPFIKPAVIRNLFPEEKVEDYTDACRVAIEKMQIDQGKRNVLLAHQFVTGATRCDSEEITVGGLDNVNASVFDGFDYVALGHIHGKQKIGRNVLRYCGTPLKYSFSEKDHKKSVTIVEMNEKGNTQIREVPLKPLHDMRQIRGTYEELTLKKNYENTDTDDYIHCVLTDEQDIVDAMAKLRIIYPNLMKISYDNKRTRQSRCVTDAVEVEQKSPMELFLEFYEKQNNQEMSKEQQDLTEELIEKIWGCDR